MPNVSAKNLDRAVVQLGRSEKGQQAMRDLLALLENGGISLDADNQTHVLCLLSGAWGNYAGTVLETLREVVNPQGGPVSVERTAT